MSTRMTSMMAAGGRLAIGGGLAAALPGAAPATAAESPPATAPAAPPPAAPPPATSGAPTASMAGAAGSTFIGSAALSAATLAALTPISFNPELFGLVSRTTTQLARAAVTQLSGAPREQLQEAIDTVAAKNIAPERLMSYLERRVRIGEVLNELTDRWSAETIEDFATAFQMDRSRTAAMDLIVDLGILNDPQLEVHLRAENQPTTTDSDLLDRRQVVWQHPAPGTPLEPPFMMLVAVAYQDTAQAEDVVNSIVGQLVEVRGFRMPREAAARLRG